MGCEFLPECDGSGSVACECFCERCEDHVSECDGCRNCETDEQGRHSPPQPDATHCVHKNPVNPISDPPFVWRVLPTHEYVTGVDPAFQVCRRCQWPRRAPEQAKTPEAEIPDLALPEGGGA